MTDRETPDYAAQAAAIVEDYFDVEAPKYPALPRRIARALEKAHAAGRAEVLPEADALRKRLNEEDEEWCAIFSHITVESSAAGTCEPRTSNDELEIMQTRVTGMRARIADLTTQLAAAQKAADERAAAVAQNEKDLDAIALAVGAYHEWDYGSQRGTVEEIVGLAKQTRIASVEQLAQIDAGAARVAELDEQLRFALDEQHALAVTYQCATCSGVGSVEVHRQGHDWPLAFSCDACDGTGLIPRAAIARPPSPAPRPAQALPLPGGEEKE